MCGGDFFCSLLNLIIPSVIHELNSNPIIPFSKAHMSFITLHPERFLAENYIVTEENKKVLPIYESS